jgi:hypothetical protein
MVTVTLHTGMKRVRNIVYPTLLCWSCSWKVISTEGYSEILKNVILLKHEMQSFSNVKEGGTYNNHCILLVIWSKWSLVVANKGGGMAPVMKVKIWSKAIRVTSREGP